MVELKRILAPVDFSAGSAAAFAYARMLAEAFGASVEVLHVVQPPHFAMPLVTVEAQSLSFDAYARNVSSIELQQFLTEQRLGAHVAVTGRLEFGDPAHIIVKVAAEGGINLIVMGAHGRTGLSHFLVGSVAEKVVRHAHCPVLAVPLPKAPVFHPTLEVQNATR
jgi:nucleotide-binding universal stress UspA family protein